MRQPMRRPFSVHSSALLAGVGACVGIETVDADFLDDGAVDRDVMSAKNQIVSVFTKIDGITWWIAAQIARSIMHNGIAA